MTLTVLSVAYPLAPVGPDAVGGAEQVLTRLDATLESSGQRSIVVACEGSRAAGMLIQTPLPRGSFDDHARRVVHAAHRANIERALEQNAVDIVHLHGIDADQYMPPAGVPALLTLHLPPSWYPPALFQLRRADTFLHCVSPAQQRTCPPSPILLPAIENGVDVERFSARVSKRDYVMALGRVCPEKGFHLAFDAAKRAGIRMLLGGEVYAYPAHQAYYEQEIVPRLDARRCFVGLLSFERKRRLLAGARCLLVPSLAPETSSLVAMEALACGTPVIAFAAGALPEIIEHGRTGFIVRDEYEMTEAIHAARALDPDLCRLVARERFSATRMVAEYFALYERLAQLTGRAELSAVG